MVLPNEWKEVKLGECFDIQLGKMLNEAARKQEPQFPYIANVNVRWGALDLSTLSSMFFSEREKEKFALKKNDILMCEGGEIGRCVVLKENVQNIYYQKACHRLRAKNDLCDPWYLYFYMSYIVKSSKIIGLVGESSIAHLPVEKVEKILLTLPPLAEQKKIAETLSVWDSAIEKMEMLIQSKNDLLAEYGSQLFGKKNCVRRGWENVCLSSVLIEHGDKSTGNEKVFSVSVHKGLVDQVEHLGRSFAAANTSNYNRAHYGDVIYTKSPTGNFPLGIVKQSLVKEDVIVSPLYGVFTPKTFELGVILDFYFSSATNANNYLHPIAQKGAKNTINITNKTFLSAKLTLPLDPVEQRKIADFIQTAKEEMSVLQDILKNYKKQKQGLMQKLLTGEWRV